jgi:restriction endonuclease S subunit
MITEDMRDSSFFIRIVKNFEIDHSDMNPMNYRNGLNLISISSKIKLVNLNKFADTVNEKISIKDKFKVFKTIDLRDIDKTIGEVTNIKELLGYELSEQKTKLENNDIIFGKLRPYLNNIAIIQADDEKFIGSTEWVRIIPKSNPFYLLLALRSNYVLSQTLTTKGSVRPRFKEKSIPNIKIPKLDDDLIKIIDNIMADIFIKRKRSNMIIRNLIDFYDSLIKNFDINENLTLVTNKVETTRMDAEFYFYKKISRGLKNIGSQKLIDCINFSEDMIDSYFTYGDSINYITISDVDTNLGEIVSWRDKVYSKNIDRSVKAPNRAKMLLKSNDILLPHLKGSLSSVAWVPEEMNNFIGTNGFSVIRYRNLEIPFLYIALRSKTIQIQLSLLANGTVMEDLSNDQIGGISIFIPDIEIKDKIIKNCQIALKERWLSRQSYHSILKAFHEYCSVHANKEIFMEQLNRINERLSETKLIKIPLIRFNSVK